MRRAMTVTFDDNGLPSRRMYTDVYREHRGLCDKEMYLHSRYHKNHREFHASFTHAAPAGP